MNVLIVDDYPTNRKLLHATLEGAGHGVLEAANGVEALRVLEHEAVDAVISDILMPRMDGFRLCREIRKCGRRIPIVLYTATYNSPSDRELAENVGADYYLLKPAPTASILEALQTARRKALTRAESHAARADDACVLEQYSEALVRKLEARSGEVHDALASLQTAHQHILELNRTLETRVAQRTAALNVANQELEAFSYSISHDLRAPLRHIGGCAQLLASSVGAQLNGSDRECLQHIIGATEKMHRLIEALLELARTSHVELKVGTVNLDTLVDAVLETMQGETQHRSIRWQRSRLPSVRGDATLLRQVLLNLVSNAIKYSRRRDPAIIEIGARDGRAHETVIFVSDNGVGFDLRQAGELFGVFRRFHRADQYEGTGIGLANARRIITRHGGAIWAEAAVDRGATFFFSLPKADDQ